MISTNANASTTPMAALTSPADNRADGRPTPEMAQDLHRAEQMHGAQSRGTSATSFSAPTAPGVYRLPNDPAGKVGSPDIASPVVEVHAQIRGAGSLMLQVHSPSIQSAVVSDDCLRSSSTQARLFNARQQSAGDVYAANTGVRPANVFDKAMPQWQSAIVDGDESSQQFYTTFIDARMASARPQIADAVLDQFAQRIVELPDSHKLAAFQSILKQDGGVDAMRKAWSKIGISQFPETDRGSVMAALREHGIEHVTGAGAATSPNHHGVQGARSQPVTPVGASWDLVGEFIKAWQEAIDAHGEPDGWATFLTEFGAAMSGGEDTQAVLATLAANIHRLPEDRRFTGMKYILEDKSGLGVAAVKSVVSDRGTHTADVFAAVDRPAALDLYFAHGIIQVR